MHIARNSRGISKIYLKFDDTRAGVKAMNADIIKLRKNSSPVIKRTLMLVWGCTVHKVKGLSLDKIVASLDLLRQRNCNYR